MTLQACEVVPKGTLSVICGPMYAGKTEELIKRINIAKICCLSTFICKHSFDTRILDKLSCRAHLTQNLTAIAIIDPMQILDISHDAKIIAIDEAQFFRRNLIPVINRLLVNGKDVIISGLDMDFKKEPFGECMPSLLCMADEVVKLKAVCQVCKRYNACYTQRLINNVPASAQDEVVVIDDNKQVTYEPRCKDCHVMNLRKSSPILDLKTT